MSKTADNTPQTSPNHHLNRLNDSSNINSLKEDGESNMMAISPIIDTVENNKVVSDTNKKKDRTKKPKKPRCAMEGCRKKLRITDTKCRCEKIFCHKHRCAVDHKCAKLHEKDDHETHSKRCGLGGGVFSKLDRI